MSSGSYCEVELVERKPPDYNLLNYQIISQTVIEIKSITC